MKCPKSGNLDGIPKENAWIVFALNENAKITDMEVYELDKNNQHRWNETVLRIENHFNKKKSSYRDFGVVYSDWNEWELIDVFFKIAFQYGFEDKNVTKKCLESLARIKEFKKPIEEYLSFFHIWK